MYVVCSQSAKLRRLLCTAVRHVLFGDSSTLSPTHLRVCAQHNILVAAAICLGRSLLLTSSSSARRAALVQHVRVAVCFVNSAANEKFVYLFVAHGTHAPHTAHGAVGCTSFCSGSSLLLYFLHSSERERRELRQSEREKSQRKTHGRFVKLYILQQYYVIID